MEIATALDSCFPLCHYSALEVILECCVPLTVEHCITNVPSVAHLKVGGDLKKNLGHLYSAVQFTRDL